MIGLARPFAAARTACRSTLAAALGTVILSAAALAAPRAPEPGAANAAPGCVVPDADVVDLDAWFAAGQCAAQTGDHAAAASWFRRILQVVDAPRTHLELARALVVLGRTEQALPHYSAVLRSGPPEPIRSWVIQELAHLGAAASGAKTSIWRFGLGALHDTNVNAGPRDRSISIWGMPFELTPESLGKSDQGVNSWIGYEGQALMPWGVASLGVRVDTTRYARSPEFGFAHLSTQLSLRRVAGPAQFGWSISGTALRPDNGNERDGAHTSLTVLVDTGSDRTVSGTATLGSQRHQGAASPRSQVGSIEAAVVQGLAGAGRLTLGLKSGSEIHDAADLSHDDRAWTAALSTRAPRLCNGCEVTLSTALTWVRHRGPDAIFETTRQDRRRDASLEFAIPGWHDATSQRQSTWRLGFERSINESNLAMSRHQRSRATLSKEWVR